MNQDKLSQWQTLWRIGGMCGMIAAVTVPLFVVLFYLIFPLFGFDPTQFGTPGYTLAIFGAQPFLIRLTGIVNLTTMTTSILLMLALTIRLGWQNPGLVVAGGALGILGWLMVLVAEQADLSAFIHLSQLYETEPALAKTGFVMAVAFGRQARGWGYLLLALSLVMLSGPLGQIDWSPLIKWLTVSIVPFTFLLFLFDNVVLVDTGSLLFGLVFAVAGTLLALWNGWIGLRLWRS